ncbi:16S rRNA pseudouridine516 synthase [Alteromonadaceae bacterium Bs31]|nr:16S rRNA pseudouridine516 synthase [Alteromonadaceae bacterium Bs31]
MRLDKFLADNSPYSRKQVASLIKQGRIRINSERASSSSVKLGREDSVTLDEQVIEPFGDYYLMLNKPVGYVSATSDSVHATVIDLLHSALPSKLLKSLQIAGRLDIDTTGLVLLTNDGQWNHAITAPSRACSKVYLVETENDISPETEVIFNQGILLHGEKKPTRPATIQQLGPRKARLSIAEGKYHQVKRMFAACNNRVVSLHRMSVGAISLDEKLAQGEYRRLSADEVQSVYAKT